MLARYRPNLLPPAPPCRRRLDRRPRHRRRRRFGAGRHLGHRQRRPHATASPANSRLARQRRRHRLHRRHPRPRRRRRLPRPGRHHARHRRRAAAPALQRPDRARHRSRSPPGRLGGQRRRRHRRTSGATAGRAGRRRRILRQRLPDRRPAEQRGDRLAAAIVILLIAFGSVVAMGLPDRDRTVRHRHRDRRRRCRRQLPQHARLHAAGRVDDRHRRGHRLRPLHRHPLPRRRSTAGSSAEAAVRRGARHGRPGRRVRRLHRDDLAPRHVPHGHRHSSTASPSARRSPSLIAVLAARHAAARPARLRSAATSTGFASIAGARREARRAVWHRWSRFVQRRPGRRRRRRPRRAARRWPSRSSRCAWASPTRATTRPGSTTRTAYDLLAEGFGPGSNGPLHRAGRHAATPAPGRALPAARSTRCGRRPASASVSAAGASPSRQATPAIASSRRPRRRTGPPQRLVHQLRDDVVPSVGLARSSVGGQTAGGIDFADRISARLPLFIGAVLAAQLPAAAGRVPLDPRAAEGRRS